MSLLFDTTFNFESRGWSPPVDADFWYQDALASKSSSLAVTPAAARKLLVAFACVALKARKIATLNVFVGEKSLGSNYYKPIDHPLNEFLQNKPNPNTHEYGFFETIVHHVDLWGNFYALLTKDRRGNIVAMTQIADPSSVGVLLSDKRQTLTDGATVEKGRLIYTVRIDGEVLSYSVDSVLHIPNISQNGIVGLSQIGIYREAVGLGLASQKYQTNFFENGALVKGVLSMFGSLGENEKTFERSMERKFAQLGKNEIPIVVLGDEHDYNPLTMPAKDAQFLESQDWNAKVIAGWFGVPPDKVGLSASTAYNSIEASDHAFRTDCIIPLGTRISQPMTNSCLTKKERKSGLRVVMDYDSLFRADKATQAEYNTKMFGLGVTANEILAREGFAPIGPDGDISYRPAQLVVAGAMENADTDENANKTNDLDIDTDV